MKVEIKVLFKRDKKVNFYKDDIKIFFPMYA